MHRFAVRAYQRLYINEAAGGRYDHVLFVGIWSNLQLERINVYLNEVTGSRYAPRASLMKTFLARASAQVLASPLARAAAQIAAILLARAVVRRGSLRSQAQLGWKLYTSWTTTHMEEMAKRTRASPEGLRGWR